MTTFADGLYQYGGQPVGNMPDANGATYPIPVWTDIEG